MGVEGVLFLTVSEVEEPHAGPGRIRIAVHAAGLNPVDGGAGGVGLIAVQLGVLRGARVIGTAGEADQEFVRSLGVTSGGKWR